MALPQRRAVELRRIATEAEYRAALARIAELAASDDLELVGEMDALANYVEAWEESDSTSRPATEQNVGRGSRAPQ